MITASSVLCLCCALALTARAEQHDHSPLSQGTVYVAAREAAETIELHQTPREDGGSAAAAAEAAEDAGVGLRTPMQKAKDAARGPLRAAAMGRQPLPVRLAPSPHQRQHQYQQPSDFPPRHQQQPEDLRGSTHKPSVLNPKP